MKSTAAFLLTLVLLIGQTSCLASRPVITGSGNSKAEVREVPPFTKIAVGGAFDVNVKIGKPQTVVITADDNLLGEIETKVEDGTLKVGSESSLRPKAKMKIDITVASLSAASLAGSGDVKIDGLAEQSFKFSIAGSGDVYATGSVEDLKTDIAGSGSLKLENLAAKSAKVSIAGSGDAAMNVSDSLAVSIAGSGDVTYVGDPQIKKSIAGSGSVRQKQKI